MAIDCATIRFPSATSDQHAYTWASDGMAFWDQAYRARNPLGTCQSVFPVLGDGMTQHGCHRAATLSDLVDYCYSLATYLHSDRATREERNTVAYHWPRPPSVEAITFALTVVYKDDGKPRYFNLQERKISAAPGKAHDKRWTKVKSHLDGGLWSTLVVLSAGRLHPGELDGPEPWALSVITDLLAIQRVRRDQGNGGSDTEVAVAYKPCAEIMESAGADYWAQTEAGHKIVAAFNLVAVLAEGYRASWAAQNALENFASCYMKPAPAAEEAAEEAAA